jgi:hypothetical protein
MRLRPRILKLYTGIPVSSLPPTTGSGFATLKRGAARTRKLLRAAIVAGTPLMVRYRKLTGKRQEIQTFVIKPLSLRYRNLKIGQALVLYADRIHGGKRGMVSLLVANILDIQTTGAHNAPSPVLNYRP